MYPVSHLFNGALIAFRPYDGINYSKIKDSFQEVAKENFIRGEEEVNANHNPPCDTSFQLKSETKNTSLFISKRLRESSPICKNTFQGDQRNFSSGRRVKIVFEKLEKSYKRLNDPKHSQGLFYRLYGGSLPTKSTNKGNIKESSGRTFITRGEGNTGEGCHKEVNSLQGPVCQLSVSSIKEGWR